MPDSSVPGDHPTDEAFAAYLDQVLSPSERAEVNAHVGDCEYCRSRLVLASRALQSAPVLRRRMYPLAAGVLAAAGLAGVLLLSRSAAHPDPNSPAMRTTEETSPPPLRTLAPAGTASITPARLRFVWAALAPDAIYQLTLSAADGRVLWTTRTGDTVITPPVAALHQLTPGQSYFWRVDALLSSLQSITSGDQRFQVAAP